MSKNGVCDLAYFGGAPIFERPRPIGQLDSPEVDQFLALLRISYDRHHLTNGGPLVMQLEERLCAYHDVNHCIAVANAALGLTMILQLFAIGRRGEVILPSFTYRGLPHFIQWAGQIPRFCDVDPETHALDPDSVKSSITKNTTAILAVCNFNDPGYIDELCQLGDQYDIPVIFDSVYGLGSTYKGKPLGRFGHAEVFSLHATKLLNGFEGGYITTENDDLADVLRWQRNFALPALEPECGKAHNYILGCNAKLNEAHAAMALACLERLDDVIGENKRRYEAYRKIIESIDGLSLLPYQKADSEKRNYQMVVVEIHKEWPLTRDQTILLLQAEGMMVYPYYSPPLHRSTHCPDGIEVPSLPVSEDLATRFCQLPVGNLVSMQDIDEIGGFMKYLSRHGYMVSARLVDATA